MEGTVLIKRICGHSSPYTFKKNEKYGKQRLETFLSKKCPACTLAAIKELEAKQKEESQRRKAAKRQAKLEQQNRQQAEQQQQASAAQ